MVETPSEEAQWRMMSPPVFFAPDGSVGGGGGGEDMDPDMEAQTQASLSKTWGGPKRRGRKGRRAPPKSQQGKAYASPVWPPQNFVQVARPRSPTGRDMSPHPRFNRPKSSPISSRKGFGATGAHGAWRPPGCLVVVFVVVVRCCCAFAR